MILTNAVLRFLSPNVVASAHCDLPCGVYDPEQARIEAESCYRVDREVRSQMTIPHTGRVPFTSRKSARSS